MKIGKPVQEIPKSCRDSRWESAWGAAREIEDGLALPVEFDSLEEAKEFQGSYATAKRRGLKLALRGNTVYITRLNGRN